MAHRCCLEHGLVACHHRERDDDDLAGSTPLDAVLHSMVRGYAPESRQSSTSSVALSVSSCT